MRDTLRRGGTWHAPETNESKIIKAMMTEPTITTAVETITPKLAAEYLTHNTSNPRRLMDSVVRRYADDMKSGKWQSNGESIVFSKNGELRDGQHRLEAVVLSGVTVQMVVVRGVEDGTTIYDVGAKRNVAQAVGATRVEQTIAGCVCCGLYGANTAPAGIVADYIVNHRAELNSAGNVAKTGNGGRVITMKRSIMTAVYLMLRSGTNEDGMRAFIRTVNTGFPLEGWDSTAAIAFAAYIRNTMPRDNTHEITADIITVTIQAFRDFANGVARRQAYRNPRSNKPARDLMSRVRKADGLE